MSEKLKSNDTAHNAEADINAGLEKTLSTMKNGMENATRQIGSQQLTLKESMAKAMKTTEEMMAFSQGNLEALIKAGQIVAAGMQDFSKHFVSSTQASVEETVAMTKAFAGVKSVKEAVDLQTGFTRSMMEKAVSETTKMTDASMKLTEQAIAPLTARMTLAVEKFSTSV